ncbi:MAG: hypothetical protein Q7J80_06245, partial [Anaerolineales bacterium]|nr:hypothetical protein [Anaerolineales bacterium]
VCQECGRAAASYMGKCPQCGSFNSMVEEVVDEREFDGVAQKLMINSPRSTMQLLQLFPPVICLR